MKNVSKYAGILLIVVGIIVLIFDKSAAGAEMPLLVGLFILFISKGEREDERAVSIKTSSAYIALIVAYSFTLLSANLYSHKLVSFQLTEINHFLIVVFTLAIIIYYSRMYTTSK